MKRKKTKTRKGICRSCRSEKQDGKVKEGKNWMQKVGVVINNQEDGVTERDNKRKGKERKNLNG